MFGEISNSAKKKNFTILRFFRLIVTIDSFYSLSGYTILLQKELQEALPGL